MDTRRGERIAEEQAALRRVAVLAAGGTPPEEMFAAVTAEVGRLLAAGQTSLARYDPNGEMATVAFWGQAGKGLRLGQRIRLGGRNVSTLVFETGRSARIDDYSQASGPIADSARKLGMRSFSSVGVPVSVGGRLWGVMIATSSSEEPLPSDTEERLAGFTELVGAAIANAQAHVDLRGYAEEQAALRRVATLVAGGAPAERVFATVTEEIGRAMSAEYTAMGRYDADGKATVVGVWTSASIPWPVAVGDRVSLAGRTVLTRVFETGQPARVDDYGEILAVSAAGFGPGFGSAGVPIRVGGRLWGAVTVGAARKAALPSDTEVRLAAFTELAGTAIANAEAQEALAASRARIVAAADEARRRIERDLHDGAQQRLVTLALRLRAARSASSGPAGLAPLLGEVADGLETALAELREIARGIHPAALTDGGLGPALKALARSCAIPVDLRLQVRDRPPEPVEIAAYYVVCEALTNTVKHASASSAEVEVVLSDGVLRVRVRDDGRGGADFGHGSGLIGLRDRVEALGGRILLHSPPGKGTALEVYLPVGDSC
jgi:GAF domain-containing protein